MASLENELLLGLGAALGAAGAGHFHPTDVYPAGVLGIFLTPAPTTHPNAMWLTTYPVGHPGAGTDSTIGVQLRTRAATAGLCNDMAGDVFSALHGRWGERMGTVRIEQILWRSASPLGDNGQGLYERADNYYVDVYNPAPHRV